MKKAHPLLIIAVLIGLAALAHGSAIFNDFIAYDDPVFVTENAYVQGGVTQDGIGWAFTTFKGGNWNPVVWLSHMAVIEAAGPAPMAHHLANLLLHMAGAVLLFFTLRQLTGAMWRSAVAAAVFAVHPVHVESIAWVSERKDVLSLPFALLAVMAYAKSARLEGSSRLRWTLAAMLFLALGLMAKPMLVSVPLLLLLLDYWPLERVRPGGESSLHASWTELLREKLPLFLVVAVFCGIALLSQSNALAPLDEWSLWQRTGNVLTSYVTYLGKLFAPTSLAPIYPLRKSIALWKILSSAAVLLAITITAIRMRRTAPYLLVGWLWYLIAMLPVIGVVQIGIQSMADRYTYLPFIGLYIALVWGVHALLSRLATEKQRRGAAVALCVVALGAGAMLSRAQTSYWKDTVTLFRHTLEVTDDNPMAHQILGNAYLDQKQPQQALEHYEELIRLRPTDGEGYLRAAIALLSMGRYEAAAEQLRQGISKQPDSLALHKHLALAMYKLGDLKGARRSFAKALEIAPGDQEAAKNIEILDKRIEQQRANATDRHQTTGVPAP